MKRFWIGVGFLGVIFVCSLWVSVMFERIHRPLSEDLEKASQAALSGDWEQAKNLTEKAKGEWSRIRDFVAASADHEPLEEMEALFSQLQATLQQRDGTIFTVLCIRLASMADAMADSQSLHWWSLL